MEGKNTVFDIYIRSYETGKPLITMTVSGGMTIGKLKKAFTENCKQFNGFVVILSLESEIFYPEKQLYWHGGISLKRDYMTLNDYDIKAADTLYVQDKGVQVSYRLSQLMINIGPIITFSLLWLYRKEIYNFCLTSHEKFDKEKVLS